MDSRSFKTYGAATIDLASKVISRLALHKVITQNYIEVEGVQNPTIYSDRC